MRLPMIQIHLPLGIRLELWPTQYRPPTGLHRNPCSTELWVLWFCVSRTWYATNRRGQNAILINNAELFSVFPR
jgi:hypothetical protein